jgi:hypothetical protein
MQNICSRYKIYFKVSTYLLRCLVNMRFMHHQSSEHTITYSADAILFR